MVPDVFATTPDPRKVLDDWKEFARGFGRLTSTLMFVLAIIWREQRVTLAKLGSLTYFPPETARRNFIDPLLDLGLIQPFGTRSYEPSSWCEWRPSKVVTVEAKLTNWRIALEQASDNRQRSDFSYAAFPADGLAHRDAVLNEARSKGVGIIEVSPDTGPIIVLEGKGQYRQRKIEKWVLSLRILVGLLRMPDRWAFASD
jgi:hypothetical protein